MKQPNARFFKKDVEEVDAILPFMSLLIIIIPLLLSNLAFYHFQVIETSYPGASEPNSEDNPVPDKKKKLMAQLLIEPDIIQLEILDESDGSTVKKERKDATADNGKELYEVLKKLNERYPKLDTILVTTHEQVTYNSLTSILHEFKTPILKDGSKDKENAFKFKMVILPATAEKTLPAGS